MLTVTFRGLDAAGEDEEIGSIHWDGQKATPDAEVPFLVDACASINAYEDPEGFVKQLPTMYSGAYLRAELTEDRQKAFDPNEKRDENGEWTAGGAGDVAKSPYKPAKPVTTKPEKKERPAPKPAHEMTRQQFERAGFYQHTVLRPDAPDIGPEGFRLGVGPNAMPSTDSGPQSIMGKKFGTKQGMKTYVVPKSAITLGGNGAKIKQGWLPTEDDTVFPSYDGQPLHEAVIEMRLHRGKPVPPEVLQEYPKLVEKYSKPAQSE